jgi:hypothetical protein
VAVVGTSSLSTPASKSARIPLANYSAAASGELLRRAGTAGEIRNDISPEDLLRALVGMCYTHDQPGWQKNVLRLVDVFVDGLRYRHSKRRMEAHQKISV